MQIQKKRKMSDINFFENNNNNELPEKVKKTF